MNFRFKIRLFFLFFVFALFFLFFFSVVFDFSSFNNKKTPKLYNTTFKSEGSYEEVSEEKAKEVWEYFQANEDLYSTLKNNGYKVGGVNIDALPTAKDISVAFTELKNGSPDVLTTLKKLAFANVYKSFSPTNWIQAFQSYGGRHLIALLKLLGLNDLTVKGKSYSLVELQKINWRKLNAQKNQKLIQNIGDLKTKSVSDVRDFDKVKALEELASLVASPKVKLYDLFDAANKILSTKTGISLEEKMKIVPVITESVASPQKMKALFDYLKNPLYYSVFQWKFFERGIDELKISNKKYSVKKIVKGISDDDFTRAAAYNELGDAIKAELEALVKDGIDFFKLISALDYRLHEMLFDAFASTENDLLAKIKKVRYFTFLRKGDDKSTKYTLVNIKEYDFSKVESFFDIEDAAVKQEMTHLINAKFIPKDFDNIFSDGYKQEELIDQLKLPANKSKILDKMQALELDKLNIGGIEYDIQTFRKIDFTKISDHFLDSANRKGPKWDQIKALSDAGITLEQMNDALNAKLVSEKANIQSEVERVWTVLKEGTRLADIEKFNVPEIIGKNDEKISLTNLYNLKPQDNYDDFGPEETTKLLLLSKIVSADLGKKIDDAILATQKKTIEAFLAWLNDKNRLVDIKTHTISDNEINDGASGKTALSDLKDLRAADTYADLEPAEKTLLLTLSGINDAKTQIDTAIEKAKIDPLLEWLKEGTRLADITKYRITSETVQDDGEVDVDLSELANITDKSTYETLPKEKRELLLEFDDSIKTAIINLINDAKAIDSALEWLKAGTRLDDIEKYNIKEINEDENLKTALSDLSGIQTIYTYALLIPDEKTALLWLSRNSDMKTKIDTAIEKAKIDLILTWLQTGTRLEDIVKYDIASETVKNDSNVDVNLTALASITNLSDYEGLSSDKKTLLLKFDNSIKNEIDKLILNAKAIETALTWFKEGTRLADIKKYKISEINKDKNLKTTLSDLSNLRTVYTYINLLPDEKTALLWLSRNSDMKTKIDTAIKKAKIDLILTWLNDNNRLADIAKYKIASETVKDIRGLDVDLSELANIKDDSTYDNLSGPAKSLLLKIDESVKNKIDDLIKTAKEKEKINELLVWLRKDNRLSDIKTHTISDSEINDNEDKKTALSDLKELQTGDTYESLSREEKDLLLKLSGITNAKTQIDALIKDLKEGVEDLIKNFQKPNSILTKLKDLDKNKIKVKGKDLSFKNLLKVKVKDWKNPNAFKNMKPEARKELLNIMKSLSNNRKRIPEINSAIEKIEKKEDENINDQVLMWVYIGLGIFVLLMVSLFTFKHFKKKSKK